MPQPPIAPERTRPLAEQLYRKERDRLLNIARYSGARSEAEDALSRAFAQFIARYDPDGEAPALPWLVTTVKREAWSIMRARQRREGEQEESFPDGPEDLGFEERVRDVKAPDPADRALAQELSDERFAALAQLKPHERKCLGLKGLGYSYREIEEMTGWSQTKINRLMVEGRARLRELLD